MSKNDFKLIFVYKSVYGDNTPGYGIYLMNYSNEEYNVYYKTNGFISIDEEVHQLEGSKHDLKKLEANSRILVEESDVFGLDECGFVYLILKGKQTIKIDFTIGKGSPNGESISLDGYKEKGIIMNFNLELVN